MADRVLREAERIHDAIEYLLAARVHDPVRDIFFFESKLVEQPLEHDRYLEAHQVGHLRRDGEGELVVVVEPVVAERVERVGQQEALEAVEGLTGVREMAP